LSYDRFPLWSFVCHSQVASLTNQTQNRYILAGSQGNKFDNFGDNQFIPNFNQLSNDKYPSKNTF